MEADYNSDYSKHNGLIVDITLWQRVLYSTKCHLNNSLAH